MTDPLAVAAGEHAVLRLFSLNMRPEEARFLREPGAAAQVLGVENLNPDQIEIFPLSDLEDLGLVGYLTEGCGLSPDQLDPAKLDALSGWIMILRSKAFEGQPMQLIPNSGVTLVGVYTEDGTDWTAQPLPTQSAQLYSAPSKSPRQIRSEARRLGFGLFAVIMTLIILAVIKVVL
jgi:hypothetical protein